MKKRQKILVFCLWKMPKKEEKEGPPFSGLNASRKVVSLRLCPQVPLLGRAYSAPQSTYNRDLRRPRESRAFQLWFMEYAVTISHMVTHTLRLLLVLVVLRVVLPTA